MTKEVMLYSGEEIEYYISMFINKFVDDKTCKYFMYVKSDTISIEKENKEEKLVFNIQDLILKGETDHVKSAITCAYSSLFKRLGDLESRTIALAINENAASSIGSNYSFYYDLTGIYPESIIAPKKEYSYMDATDPFKINYKRTK